MASTTAVDEASVSVTDPVEIVPSTHGGKKAKYVGYTFALASNNGMRYCWRCDLRPCKSRLTTDVYGDQHRVHAYRPHNEELHRLAAEEKQKRADASHKHQPRRWIKGFRYVLERRDGALQSWRCEFSECPVRCRTHYDGLIVDEPSRHLESVHVKMGHPFTASKYRKTYGTMREKQQPLEQQRYEVDGPVEPQQEIATPDLRPSSSSPTAAAVAGDEDDVPASVDGFKKNLLAAGQLQDTGSQETDQPPSHGIRIDSGDKCQTSLPRKRKEAVGRDYEDSRADEVNERKSYSSADIVPHDDDYGSSSNAHARCEGVLKMMSGFNDRSERDMRTSYLVQIHRLLQAETSLAKQKCQVELARQKVLEQQLQT